MPKRLPKVRSVLSFAAKGLVALGGLSYVVKALIWLLNAIGLYQTGADVLASRNVIVKWFFTITQAWPLTVFMLGVFVLACIRYGSPRTWIPWLWTTKLERLRAILGRGKTMEVIFQFPEEPKATFEECVAWDKEATDLAKRLVDAGIVQHADFIRFTESWNEAGCRNAESRLDVYGCLDNVDGVGRATYRYLFGRVKRLQELIDKIDGKAPEHGPLIVSYYPLSLACMTEYQYESGAHGIMARLAVEPESVANEPGGVGVLKSVARNEKLIFSGGNLPLFFASADLPDARNKILKHGEPAYLEIIWIPEGGEAVIGTVLPNAPSFQLCSPLDRNSYYELTVSISAEKVPPTLVAFYAFYRDDAWQFHTKQLS